MSEVAGLMFEQVTRTKSMHLSVKLFDSVQKFNGLVAHQKKNVFLPKITLNSLLSLPGRKGSDQEPRL